MLVVVALPHRCAGRAANCVDASARSRFETRHHCTHGPRSGSRRGDRPVAPAANVGYRHDPVKMIGHDNPGVQFDFGTDPSGFEPFILNYPACLVQHHLMIHDFPKQNFTAGRANGDEIRSDLRIVIPVQTHRTASTPFRIVTHFHELPHLGRSPGVMPLSRVHGRTLPLQAIAMPDSTSGPGQGRPPVAPTAIRDHSLSPPCPSPILVFMV